MPYNAKDMKKYKFLGVVGLTVVLVAVVKADFAPIHKKGYCVWYDQCLTQGDRSLNCLYNGPAKTMNDTKGLELLNKICPQYAKDRKTCCSAKQLQTLDTNLDTLRQLSGRCPACLQNMIGMFCESTCSPDQSVFMDPTMLLPPFPMPGQQQSISKISYFASPEFKQGLFDSCKDVVFPENNEKILNLLCGVSAESCTPQRLVEYMGSTSNGMSPFDIDFPQIIPQNLTWMNLETFKCNQSFIRPGTKQDYPPCSCIDCNPSCPRPPQPSPPVPSEPEKCTMIPCRLVSIVLLVVYLTGFCLIKIFRLRKKLKSQSQECRKGTLFYVWGRWCSLHPFPVIIACVVFVGILAGGLSFYKVTKNPVDLWSASGSTTRTQRDIFESNFFPLHRKEQLIITVNPDYPQNNTGYREFPDDKFIPFGKVFHLDLLHKMLSLQEELTNLSVHFTENGKTTNITLEDVCFKPLAPYNEKCVIQSIFQYFQNSKKELNKCLTDQDHACKPHMVENFKADFHDHVRYCTSIPTSFYDKKFGGTPCIGENGLSVDPNVILGGFNGTEYKMADALIITFVVNNHDDESKNAKAEAWEKGFIEYMKNYVKNPENNNLTISFSTERTFQDELEQRLGTEFDSVTIIVVCSVMFVYVILTLGKNGFQLFLPICCIFIVLCSVISSIGFLSYVGQPASFIVFNVLPFLVLGVCLDNFFMLVEAYQRNHNDDVPTRIGQALDDVGPSMLLSSFAQTVVFALGTWSTMSAVQAFSIYASIAVAINFLLLFTSFIAIMSLDARLGKCCNCFSEGLLNWFMRSVYAPCLLSRYARPVIIAIFGGLLCAGVFVPVKISVDMDMNMFITKDSYLLNWYNDTVKYVSTGPPVYFVLQGPYDYEHTKTQNMICGSAGCRSDSLVQQVFTASLQSNSTFIQTTSNSWIDDYFFWLDPSGTCCRVLHNQTCTMINVTDSNNKTHQELNCKMNSEPIMPLVLCNATVHVHDKQCTPCMNKTQVGQRPTPEQFDKFLPLFLQDIPETKCVKGGHAVYSNAVQLDKRSGAKHLVNASYFKSYFTKLENKNEFIAAIKSARKISNNISKTLNGQNVFPFSDFMIFYEQYFGICGHSWQHIFIATGVVFVVTFLLMGFNLSIAAIVTFTVAMIITNLLGMMYLWDITLNAVSLVNLVMAVGISVSYCCHICNAFMNSAEESRLERAKDAVVTVGASILKGICLTKIIAFTFFGLGGLQLTKVFQSARITDFLAVLQHIKKQLGIEINEISVFGTFFFKLYLGLAVTGVLYGLIFLPVFLSYFGPDRSERSREFVVNNSPGRQGTRKSNRNDGEFYYNDFHKDSNHLVN